MVFDRNTNNKNHEFFAFGVAQKMETIQNGINDVNNSFFAISVDNLWILFAIK